MRNTWKGKIIGNTIPRAGLKAAGAAMSGAGMVTAAAAVLMSAIFTAHGADQGYFAALASEFQKVGTAEFVFGDDEKAILELMQTGGGMEKFWPDGGKLTAKEITETDGMPFRFKASFTVEEKPGVYWERSFRVRNTKQLKKGDTLAAVFWSKGVKKPQVVDDGAGAALQAYFHTLKGKYHKGRVNNFYDCRYLSEKWSRQIVKAGPLEMDFAPGELDFIVMIGHKAQTVEVGGLAVMAFPSGSNIEALPNLSLDYPGRSPDAPWRREAERRIDKYRKGNFSVTVKEKNGNPVSGADVEIELLRHEFRFGTAVRVGNFYGETGDMTREDTEKYVAASTNYFNTIVLENSLKWHMLPKPRSRGRKKVEDCLEFYKQNGMFIRGHVLVWPTIYRTPADVRKKLKANPDLTGPVVAEHVRSAASDFRRWINDWDVTNETDVNRDFMDLLGPESMAEWYRAAAESAPDAELTFNEPRFGAQGMEIGSFPQNLLSADMHGWVDYIISSGARLDNLGAQCHGGLVSMDYKGKTGAEAIWAYFDDLYGRYGRSLQYTELDVNNGNKSDPEHVRYQADKLRDTIIIAFAHPAFVGITQWGFWEGAHYAPNAALWDKQWHIRLSGAEYVNLVKRVWHTEESLRTDDRGACSARAFFGRYSVKVNGRKIPDVEFKNGDIAVEVTVSGDGTPCGHKICGTPR